VIRAKYSLKFMSFEFPTGPNSQVGGAVARRSGATGCAGLVSVSLTASTTSGAPSTGGTPAPRGIHSETHSEASRR
jgi:hypothetical protein